MTSLGFSEEEEENSAENDDEDESQSLRKLLRELPETIETTGPDSVDISVIEANSTADFLHPDGRIKEDRVLLMELHVSKIPSNTLIPVAVQFGSNVSRNIFVYRCTSPVRAKIGLVRSPKSQSDTGTDEHFQYRVDFSNYIFSPPDGDEMDCSDVRNALAKFTSQHLTSESDLKANDLQSVRNAARDLSDCFSQPSSSVPEEVVRVTGVSAEINGTQNLQLQNLRKGESPQTSVLISFEANVKRRTRMEISIQPPAGVVDLAGQPIEEQSESYRIERRNRATQRAVDQAEKLGIAFTVMASTSVATSVAVSVGSPVVISVSQSMIASVAEAMTFARRSMSAALELLRVCQHIYLVSKMGVPNMPENFEAFGEALSWTMLYIKVPWRNDTEDQRVYLLGNETEDGDGQSEGDTASDVVVFEREWPYKRLVLVLFWALILFVSLVTLHCIIIAILFGLRLSLHDKLRFPRLELYFLCWAIPATAGGCASLFTGNISTTHSVASILPKRAVCLAVQTR